MILLTHETDFFERKLLHAWPELAQAENVTWGIASKNALHEHFAPRALPMMYIFDQIGLLRVKIKGETKLEKILTEIRKNWWSEPPATK